MIEVVGKYNTAKVMVPNESDLEDYARAQIKMICDVEGIGENIVIMPDVHPGKVGPIGLTMDITNAKYVMPALIGPDIGCGISIIKLGKIKKDFEKLDTVIRECVPVGPAKHKTYSDDKGILFKTNLNTGRPIEDFSEQYMGTLGSGNHFIEVGQENNGDYYLTVHSGSRGLGHYVYEWYMREGQKAHKILGEDVPYEMTRLSGDLKNDYIMDTYYCNEFAVYNRHFIINTILKKMKWDTDSVLPVDKAHNFIVKDPIGYYPYISTRTILRKGATDTRYHWTVIPINSRDGIMIAYVDSKPEWNNSCPHGSGRIIKRSEVRNSHTLSEYKKVMKEAGVWSPSISKETLDEAPFAYRNLDYVLDALKDVMTPTSIMYPKSYRIIKPIYNFKGGEQS